jgi:hypothetical protein
MFLPNHRQRSSPCYFSAPAARRCRWIRGSSSATSHPQEYLPVEPFNAAQLRVAAIASTEAQSKCRIPRIPPPFQTKQNSIQSKRTSAESSPYSLLTRFLQLPLTLSVFLHKLTPYSAPKRRRLFCSSLFLPLCFPTSLPPVHLVRKLICLCATPARAITNLPPTAALRTGEVSPAPSINQNIPRIAHTDINTAKITDIRKISATAAPSIKVSISSSIKCANAKQICTPRANSKTVNFQGNSPIHRQAQRVANNTLWGIALMRIFLWHRLQPVDSSARSPRHPFAANQIKRYISFGKQK